MSIEHEIKILEIDPKTIDQQLRHLGAQYLGKKSFRRYVYDMKPATPDQWMRLRTDGTTTTLAIKHIVDPNSIDGTREREVAVDDFETTNTILNKLWYEAKSYQENNRESYLLEDCEIEIDHRPHIPPYLEIEWPSQNSVEHMIDTLGLSGHIHTSENTTEVYARYGIDDLVKQFPTLNF